MRHLFHRTLVSATLIVMTFGIAPVFAKAKTWNFDRDKVQALPVGWLSEKTGQGPKGDWKVVADPTAPSRPNVLAQLSADATVYRFPLAIVEKTAYKDLVISVRFKAVSGARDQGAGLVWRFRDAYNYYLVRANALENNVVLYKVQDGNRIALAPKGTSAETYGVKARVPGNAWNQLRVEVKGNLFAVFLNGQKLFDVEDSTFVEGGKIGLWTKSDSIIYFDDFTAEGE
jgi:hypothetical protein